MMGFLCYILTLHSNCGIIKQNNHRKGNVHGERCKRNSK
nr:MAG TPA: hypothetical protein [Caudoviricetes sp.]